jgi:hypothetical protein
MFWLIPTLADRLGFVLIALSATMGAVVAVSDELRETLKKGVESTQLFTRVTELAGEVWDKFGFTLGTSEAKMEGLTEDMRSLEQVFASATPKVDEAANAVLKLSDITDSAFGQGAIQGAKDYFDGIRDNAAIAKDFVTSAFNSLERTLSDFFVSGEISFKSFGDAIKRGLAVGLGAVRDLPQDSLSKGKEPPHNWIV